jgi:hypothetical protein
MKQTTFALNLTTKKTRKQIFLEQMEKKWFRGLRW